MATGSINFKITETDVVARSGGTLSSMRWPIAVPLRFDENKLNASQFRVVDTTTSQAVPAAFRIADVPYSHSRVVGGARWGTYGDQNARIKLVHIDMTPTLNKGETRVFQLQTSGGSGNSAGGITVGTTNPAYYEVNTGPQGILCRVPRTGAMDIIRFLQENSTGRIISNGGGGLVMRGVAGIPTGLQGGGANPNPTNNQGDEYFSVNDTSGDGASNDGDVLELARPTKYYTSILHQNSQSVCIKIDTIRCRNASGTVFRGMNKFYTVGSLTTRDVTWDVYLYFFRNSAAIRLVTLCMSTGGDEGFVSSQCSSPAVTSCGFEFATTITGATTQAAIRDETGTNRLRRVTSATTKTVRQRRNPVSSSYGFTLNSTGDFPVSTAPTMLDACYDVSDGQKGLLVMLRDWRERQPMGWAHTPATGRLRAEFLNPEEKDHDGVFGASNPTVAPDANCYLMMGSWWPGWETWLVAHTGAFTDEQINTHVRALAGQHEQKQADVWNPTPSPLVHGAQNPTLFGWADSEHWHDTHIWRAMPTISISRPDLLGLPNTFIGLPSKTDPTNSALNDVHARWDAWQNARHDDAYNTLEPANVRSQRYVQANTGFRQWWSWKNFGCVPCSGGAFCANEYEAHSTPMYHFLRRGDRGDLQLFYESVFHQATIDQFHILPGIDRISGRMSDIHNGGRHFDVAITGVEYQNQTEGFALAYFLTGEAVFLDAVINFLSNYDAYFYGVVGGSWPNHQNHEDDTGTVTNGVLTVANPSRFHIGPPDYAISGITERIGVRPANLDANNHGGVVSARGWTVHSSGPWIILDGTIAGRPAEWSDFCGGFPAPDAEGVAQTNSTIGIDQYSRWPGSVFKVGTTEYKVRMLSHQGFFGWGKNHQGDGSTTTFAWGPIPAPILAASDLVVGVGGVKKIAGTHFTVSGIGATSGTITFTAGNIPPAGSAGAIAIKPYRGRLAFVTPDPTPALSGSDLQLLFWTGFFYRWILTCTGKSGNTLTGSWLSNDVPPSGTAVTVHPYLGFPQSRAHTWALAGVLNAARIFGRTLTTKYPTPTGTRTWNLYERIANGLRFMRWWEQMFTAPSVRAGVEPRGMGAFPYLIASSNVHVSHGMGCSTHSTFNNYPSIPIMSGHEFGVQARAQGHGATEFDAAFDTEIGDLIYRMCCSAQMGADGLSPITTVDKNGATTAKRMPIARGGRLNAPNSYMINGTMYEWSWSSDPATATRNRGDFFFGTETPSGFTAFGNLFWSNDNGDAQKINLFMVDLMAYTARTKLHAAVLAGVPGAAAKRDLWAQRAMDLYASAVCLTNKIYLFGDARNPQTAYPAVDSGWSISIGGDFGRASNVPQYRLKHGFEVMQLAKSGFSGGPADTTRPVETTLLAEVSKTEAQIIVDGPAATDNVGVVAYRFMKGGVQDGIDQSGTQHTYAQLAPSTQYTLQRFALDLAGNISNPGSNILTITTNAAVDVDAPTVPTIASPRVLAQDSITYTWNASTDPGSNPSGVRRYRFQFDGGAEDLIDHPTTTIQKLGLTAGSTHTARVRAEDNQGLISAYSALVTDTTPQDDTEPPSPPGAPSLVSRTSTSLLVAFALATDNVGVTHYTALGAQSATPPLLIPNLTAFTEYPVVIRAHDAAGLVSDPSPETVMMTLRLARTVSGGSLLRTTGVPVSAYPFSVGVKFYPTALTSQFIWSVANGSGENDWCAIKMIGDGRIQAIRSNATGFAPGATSVGTATLNAWNRAVAVFESATRCTIRLNTDATAGEDTTSKTFPVGVTRMAYGGLDRLTPVQPFSGRLADGVVWTSALDAVQQGHFLAGADPWTVSRPSLVSFAAFYGQDPEPDLLLTRTFTLVGTVGTADGPEDVLNLTDPTPPGDPEAPTNLAVSALGATTVSITFTQGVNTSGTRVRRTDTSVVFELPNGETLFVDNGLAPFTTYRYTFAGVNATLESAQTAPFEITTRAVHQTAATGRTLRSGITPKG